METAVKQGWGFGLDEGETVEFHQGAIPITKLSNDPRVARRQDITATRDIVFETKKVTAAEVVLTGYRVHYTGSMTTTP